MKVKKILAGAILTSSQLGLVAENQIAISDLEQIGLNSKLITEMFKNQMGVELSPSEFVRINQNEEGHKINVETLDHLSVVVDIRNIAGVYNKRSARSNFEK